MKLHVDSVQKSYDGKLVLTDVFLSCEKGQILGLLGRNGSGKSTMLKIIFGSVIGDYCYRSINDQVIKKAAQIRKHIAYLPQHNFLPSRYQVRGLITLFCDSKSRDFLMQHEYLADVLDMKAGELSGGQKRLIETMLIIHAKQDFILLDEPFNGIAPLYRDEIARLIKVQSKTKGLVVSDHDYERIIELSDQIILMHDGGTRWIKNLSELEDLNYVPFGFYS